ncbi:MAG: phosphate-starvation-inducible PsiE family protein [Gammaproteobacteria bacterium]|nr:phosphate-starvation-inducible PsiE family protein [Gammaproteobacteria bacterium]
MGGKEEKLAKIGAYFVDGFHYLALFAIGATVVWSAVHEYIDIAAKGYADLKDILLLFIYLEFGAMIGCYFKSNKLPVQFLIFIAITALARHLVIDVHKELTEFGLYLYLAVTGAILLLSAALFIIAYAEKKYGSPEDGVERRPRLPGRSAATD